MPRHAHQTHPVIDEILDLQALASVAASMIPAFETSRSSSNATSTPSSSTGPPSSTNKVAS
jgi:hypothetical protein